MATYVFPGQGSQTKGMGRELFMQFPDLTAKADAILGYSIATLCVEDPQQQLNQTQYTQPALYTVNALAFYKKMQESDTTPRFVAGHSLGEYNALLAASVFDFETGLKLVKRRGELMSQATGGAMAAIVGLSKETIETLLKEHNATSVTIANFNTHKQIVISGPASDVQGMLATFEKAGAMMVVPLKVSGAFHSPYMRQAQAEFEQYLKGFTLSNPLIPVVSNRTAKPYQSAELYTNLSEQISHSVLWTDSISYLLAQGETEFSEIGPGKVLAGLIQRIKNGQ